MVTSDAAAADLHAVHHIGASVIDLERSLAFWEPFLGVKPRWKRILDAPYLGQVVGYPGIRIYASMIDLPGGAMLELLQYLDRTEAPYEPGTAHPGNVHICLQTTNVATQRARAMALGAHPVGEGPITVASGPNRGARTAYLRDPDGITLELFEAPVLGAGCEDRREPTPDPAA